MSSSGGFGSKPQWSRQQRGQTQPQQVDPLLLWGIADLFGYLDKRVLLVLRDGKTLIGMFRSFDQFSNLVLTQTVERIHVGNRFGDIPRGVFMVRGDNVEVLGEIDVELEARSHLQRIPVNLILSAQREAEEEKVANEEKRIQSLIQRGISYPRLREAGMNDEN